MNQAFPLFAPVLLAALTIGESLPGQTPKTLGPSAEDPKSTIPALVKTLNDPNEAVRLAASDRLAKMGEPAVSALIEALKSDEPKVLLLAVRALERIGPDAKAAVPALEDLFLDSKHDLFAPAARALAKIGKDSLFVFIAALKDDRDEIRSAAIQSLAAIGVEAAPALVDALGDERVETRRLAAQHLSRLKIGDKFAVLGLAQALQDEDEQVRQNAANGLQALGKSARAAVSHLQTALSDSDPETRLGAFLALQKMDEDPRPGFLKSLKSNDPKLRIHTAALMMLVHHDVKEAAPILIEGLTMEDAALRVQAAQALAVQKLETAKVTPVLIDGLKNKSATIRRQALEGAHHLNGTAPEAGVALADLLRDPEPNLRQLVVYPLSRYRGNAQVLAVLATLAKDDDASVRQIVLQVMQTQGPEALPHILEAVLHKDADTRDHALHALKHFEGDLKAALPLLKPMLERKEPVLRQAIVAVLERLGEARAPLLRAALRDDNENVRREAVKQVADHPANAAKSAQELLEIVVEEKAPGVRQRAIRALALGGDVSLALLLELVEDRKDAELRHSTCQALAISQVRSKIAVPFLVRYLKDKTYPNRWMAANGLGNQGSDIVKADQAEGKEAIALLEDATEDRDPTLRVHALMAIASLGQVNHPRILSGLKEAKDSEGRLTILQIMSGYKYRSTEAVPVLIETLKDSSIPVRWVSAHILGQIGPEARHALPALRDALLDNDGSVRNHAQAAVSRIELK